MKIIKDKLGDQYTPLGELRSEMKSAIPKLNGTDIEWLIARIQAELASPEPPPAQLYCAECDDIHKPGESHTPQGNRDRQNRLEAAESRARELEQELAAYKRENECSGQICNSPEKGGGTP